MLYNYIKVALRNIFRHKIYSIINILGLAIGMAISMLIYVIVSNHFSYDQHFSKSSRIYRVNIATKFQQKETQLCKTPVLLVPYLLKYNNTPVEKGIRVIKGSHKLVSFGEIHHTAGNFYYSDDNFTDLFNLKFVAGDSINPLKDTASIIITTETAKKYFNKNENPIGKILHLDNGWDFKITAICEAFPRKTHFQFEFLADIKKAFKETQKPVSPGFEYLRWQNDAVVSYILLKENRDANELDEIYKNIVKNEIMPHVEEFTGLNIQEYTQNKNYYNFYSQHLTEIHTGKNIEGQFNNSYPRFYLIIFISIAIIILVMAGINFMNLTTARSSTRAVEIGLRKILGASKIQLIVQFLIESIIISFLSLLFSFVIIEIIYGLEENTNSLFEYSNILLGIIVFAIIIGILAGLYPAFYLSSIKIINVLNGRARLGLKSVKMRRLLVLIQLTITFIILISRDIIIKQLNYFNNKNLGFERELMVVKRAYILEDKKTEFIAELKKQKLVKEATFVNTLPGEDAYMTPFVNVNDTSDIKYFPQLEVNYNFLSTFGVELLQGNDFSKSEDPYSMVILTESAAKEFNIPNLKDSSYITYYYDEEQKWKMKVVGIVNDFHFQTLYEKLNPTVIAFMDQKKYFKYLVIRFTENNNTQETIEKINDLWNTYVEDKTFEYYFLDKDLHKLYKNDYNTAALFILFSVLAVIIATMGMFGLAAFTAEKRTREIGIRKAMGTPVYKIVYILSVEFLKWLGISFILASPVAYLLMSKWLTRFAYHIEIGYESFLHVGFFMFAVTIFTVSLHSYRTALKNPAKALRYE